MTDFTIEQVANIMYMLAYACARVIRKAGEVDLERPARDRRRAGRKGRGSFHPRASSRFCALLNSRAVLHRLSTFLFTIHIYFIFVPPRTVWFAS